MTAPRDFAQRLRRLAAGCVQIAPVLPPLCMLVGLAASGQARGMGGMGVLVLLYVWGAAAASLTLLWFALDVLRQARNRPTFAFAYAGLALEGAGPARQVVATLLVVLGPLLVGWLASVTCATAANCSLELEDGLLWYTPMALWLGNGLLSLGPSARTLSDRLAGGRLVARAPEAGVPMRARAWWPDALLLVPPVLAMPFSGGTGGLLGLAAWRTRRPSTGSPTLERGGRFLAAAYDVVPEPRADAPGRSSVADGLT